MKRFTDLLLSLICLIGISPLFAFLCLLVLRNLGKPIFFRQIRPGLHGQPFEMIKFRSMHNLWDDDGNQLVDSSRVGRFGRFIRSSSLDELPELWNVLKGDMSLVGPRPLLREYIDLYTPEQFRRHEVRPGVTGWAQVNGRNSLKWEEKFKLDVWYVDNHTFRLDIWILFLTLKKVILRENIGSDGDVTVTKFTGTSNE